MERIKHHINDLKKIDTQRKQWLILSAFVAVMISVIIFNWDFSTNRNVSLVLGSMGLLVSAVWWYWTMRVVRHLICFRAEETELLWSIVEEIREIKKDVKKTFEDTRKE